MQFSYMYIIHNYDFFCPMELRVSVVVTIVKFCETSFCFISFNDNQLYDLLRKFKLS